MASYQRMVGDIFKGFKHLNKTKHTYYPVNDAKGNAEVLLFMEKEMD